MALLQTAKSNVAIGTSGTTVTALFPFAVTAGNTIVVAQSTLGNASSVVTFDTQSNFYSTLVPFRSFTDGTNFVCQSITTCTAQNGSNSVTASFVGGFTPSIVVMEWFGPLLFDSSSFGQGEIDMTVGGSFATTAFTTTHPSTILITAASSVATVTSPGTGYSLVIAPT